MTPARTALTAALAVLAALTLIAAWAAGAARRDEGRAPAGVPAEGVADGAPDPGGAGAEGFAVVELFTSQGCSSCPPADRLLSELADDPGFAGRVFPLAFHVDYWDHIGWRDPFSSSEWSNRQRRYARALASGVYTPQLVVNGRWETVGSRRGEVTAAVREALARAPAAEVTLRLDAGPDAVDAEAAVRRGQAAAGRPAELWLALYQDDLETPVTRGENADRRLANDRVVRRFERAARLAAGETAAAGRAALALDAGWAQRSLGVVAFLQDPESLEILGAATESLSR
jgi:hypothetical protein